MKKTSRIIAATAGLLAVIALTACAGEKPVTPVENKTPVSEFNKSIKTDDPNKVETGWSQLEDSIEISLSGAENCLPEIEKASKNGSTVSIHLKETSDDCSSKVQVNYYTIEDAKNIERVEIYEFGYADPFELHKK